MHFLDIILVIVLSIIIPTILRLIWYIVRSGDIVGPITTVDRPGLNPHRPIILTMSNSSDQEKKGPFTISHH